MDDGASPSGRERIPDRKEPAATGKARGRPSSRPRGTVSPRPLFSSSGRGDGTGPGRPAELGGRSDRDLASLRLRSALYSLRIVQGRSPRGCPSREPGTREERVLPDPAVDPWNAPECTLIISFTRRHSYATRPWAWRVVRRRLLRLRQPDETQWVSALLRKISGGTSYQAVRWVFRH